MVRLITFQHAKATGQRIGAIVSANASAAVTFAGKHITSPASAGVKILDLQALNTHTKAFQAEQVKDMNAFIETGDSGIEWIRSHATSATTSKTLTSSLFEASEVSLLAPIPVPRRNLLCVGKNYKDHVAEVAAADKVRGIGTTSAAAGNSPEAPKYPQFFTKAPSTIVGPGGDIESHANITQWLDYEAELAVVIGKKGRDITAQQAMDYVYGFAIANDCTSRDVQRHHGQWFKGKTLDHTCPFGPMIVHKSAIPHNNPQDLSIKLWLNATLRQDGHTGNMIFPIAEIIEHLSRGFSLQPGDIILTGTPQGVGYAMKPPILLKHGDRVDIEIEHLGRLENHVM
jgi:2-keto-4-pentenoate hydratase/2-oxohepta-3-ene-1,7-dioic acid hydratase in catechol pathway